MFHLLSHTDGEGGASLLVDGFKVAMELKKKDPGAYNTLASVSIHSHASGNDGIKIMPWKGDPVLNHVGNRLAQIRWNNSDRASILTPIRDAGAWYVAAR